MGADGVDDADDANVGTMQQHRLSQIVEYFSEMKPHQRLVTVRTLWVLFELEKQFKREGNGDG